MERTTWYVCLFKTKAQILLQLDVWQQGTGHGFGSFLSVREDPHKFSRNIPLVPGHVITNEPGFCKFLFFIRKVYVYLFILFIRL